MAENIIWVAIQLVLHMQSMDFTVLNLVSQVFFYNITEKKGNMDDLKVWPEKKCNAQIWQTEGLDVFFWLLQISLQTLF